jgi:hypothetical protein
VGCWKRSALMDRAPGRELSLIARVGLVRVCRVAMRRVGLRVLEGGCEVGHWCILSGIWLHGEDIQELCGAQVQDSVIFESVHTYDLIDTDQAISHVVIGRRIINSYASSGSTVTKPSTQ